jgi:hypothetical protein
MGTIPLKLSTYWIKSKMMVLEGLYVDQEHVVEHQNP